jgi:hypothetical protein
VAKSVPQALEKRAAGGVALRFRPGSIARAGHEAAQFRVIGTRTPFRQRREARLALAHQPIPPGLRALEAFGLEGVIAALFSKRFENRFGVDVPHQFADQLPLAREAAAGLDRAGGADRVLQAFRQIQLRKLRLAQRDQFLAQLLCIVGCTLAGTLAGAARSTRRGLTAHRARAVGVERSWVQLCQTPP